MLNNECMLITVALKLFLYQFIIPFDRRSSFGKSYPESNNLVAVSRKFYETHFAIQNLDMNIQFSDTLIMVGNCLQICLK